MVCALYRFSDQLMAIHVAAPHPFWYHGGESLTALSAKTSSCSSSSRVFVLHDVRNSNGTSETVLTAFHWIVESNGLLDAIRLIGSAIIKEMHLEALLAVP